MLCSVIFRKLLRLNCRSYIVTTTSTMAPTNPSKGKKLKLVSRRLDDIMSVHDGIVKSDSDKREYRGLQLNNGLKIMLISDPKTDKSAASMDVNVGSLSDPKELEGLAHFCEHMLFLGTEKYPDEDEYSKFLSQHAGNCNAYTSEDHTNYYFDVGHKHLKEILDRFSQFFICPLFDASCTDREMNAVHSEHEKNVMSDGWRLQRLDKATANPNHPYSKFGTGNKETLDTEPKKKDICVRDELLKFHDSMYSANIMALAVLGRESLDELTDMVTPMFSSIKNKQLTVETYTESPYTEKELKVCMKVVPVKDVRNLVLTFPIPDLTEHYESNPGSYLGHLIGHEGPGSLLSELKSRGWVNSLMAGEKGGARGFDFFIIQVDLTKEGMAHVDDIVVCMYQYIDMLNTSGTPSWIFQEIKDLNNMSFKFKDKEKPTSCVQNCSESMHYFPMEDVLSAGHLVKEFRADLVEDLLARLNPDNMRITLVSKSYKDEVDVTERWYGAKYNLAPISEDLLNNCRKVIPSSKFHLPPPNEFIPTDFTIAPLPQGSSPVPELIKRNQLSHVWFKQDDKFKLPKACILFELFSPVAYSYPQHCNMVYMFTELFKDALNEYAYAAELAGLSYKFSNSVYGIHLTIKGYNNTQRVLLEKILTKMTTFSVDQKRFHVIKEMYTRSLKNFKADQPYQHASYFSHVVKSEKAWTKDELSAELVNLTLEMLQEFIPKFMKRLHVQMLMHGNLTKAEALKISETVEEILQHKALTEPLLPTELQKHRQFKIPNGSSYVFQYKNQVRKISSMLVYLQVGLQNTTDNMLLQLLAQVISEPCFNILRTREQLGYIVFSSVDRGNGVQGLRIVIQSERTPSYLEGRAEAFIEHVGDHLNEMSEAEFLKHVSSLAAQILEKPKKLGTETLKYWSELLSEQLFFKRDEVEAEHLKTLTKPMLQDFYKRYIHVSAPERSKLTIHVLGKNLDNCPTQPEPTCQGDLLPCPKLPEPTVISDVNQFKQSLELYPRVRPYLDINEAKL
ncbi:insulin-degrading enzyme [Ciona intestinalis]